MVDDTASDPDVVIWLETLGTRFVEVSFIRKRGESPMVEKHVHDPETLETTVLMSLERMGGAAVYPYHGRWALKRIGKPVRYYDSKEAAEMVAIHRG